MRNMITKIWRTVNAKYIDSLPFLCYNKVVKKYSRNSGGTEFIMKLGFVSAILDTYTFEEMIDYIKPLYEFKDKIFHVHYKDIKIYHDKLDEYGIMATPLKWMSPKLPGLGDVDWGKYVSALTDIGFDGYTCIEVEDKAFEGTKEKVEQSLILSKRYMEQFVI